MLTYALEKGFTLNGQVRCISFSPDSRYLAVGIDDEVCVWDTTTWMLDLRFRRVTASICSIAWGSRGRLFFGCSGGLLTMVTFDEKEYHTEGFRASQQPVKFIAINADGDLLALGGNNEVTIWTSQGDGLHCRPKWAFMKQLDDPQDKHDKTAVSVSGIAWADDCPIHLVVSYAKQGIVTWDIEHNIPLFKTGKISHEDASGPPGGSGDVLVGGGPYYAVPSGKEVRVYGRHNGRDFRCLESPGVIPGGSPMIWAHDGACIIVALECVIALLQVGKRRETVLDIEGCNKVTHLAWNKLQGDRGQGPIYRIASVSGGCDLRVLRADGPVTSAKRTILIQGQVHLRLLFAFSIAIFASILILITPARYIIIFK